MLRICLLLACLTGCIEVRLVACENDRVCPVGTLCDEIHQSCATPEQFAACSGLEQNADCIAVAISGGCFDGVCIPRGCGNRVVESSEMCDDGNQLSGDGCRGDCVSNETCGNGVLDADEQCDDANQLSRDECDSRCIPEQPMWSTVPTAPVFAAGVKASAYDEARQRLVRITPYVTWEWDGAQWTGTLTMQTLATIAVFYDSERGRVQALVQGSPLSLWEWDGAAWVMRPTSGAPSGAGLTYATYDRARKRAIVIRRGPAAWTIDATGLWTSLALPDPGPAMTGGLVEAIAFDEQTGSVVLLDSGLLWEFDGTTWTSSNSTQLGIQLASSGASLVYHAGRGKLWMLGGAEVFTYRDDVYERVGGVGSTWAALAPSADLPTFAAVLDVHYDRKRNVVIACCGFEYNAADPGEVLEWQGASWSSHRSDIFVRAQQAFAADPIGGRFVLFGGTAAVNQAPSNETWIWNGTWQRLVVATSPSARFGAHATFDPIRGAVILYGGTLSGGARNTETWALTGASWTLIDAAGPPTPYVAPFAIAYDPEGQRVLLATEQDLWGLSSTGATWKRIAGVPSIGNTTARITSLAWNARDALISATTSEGHVYDLYGDTWLQVLSPGTGFTAIADQRSAVTNLHPLDGTQSQVWQRRGALWLSVDVTPLPIAGRGAYDPRTGATLLYGIAGESLVTLVRTVRNGSSFESCIAGEDLDGDLLADCADPDCYWTCTPACPPYTSCN